MKKKTTNSNIDLTTISGVACYILIIIYKTQLNSIESIETLKIDFESNPFSGKEISDAHCNKFELAKELLSITNNTSTLISAFNYLKDKEFLTFTKSNSSNDGYALQNFYLSAKGIDIIENAKTNPLRSKDFARTFNLKISFNINNYIKDNNIVGAGGATITNLNPR